MHGAYRNREHLSTVASSAARKLTDRRILNSGNGIRLHEKSWLDRLVTRIAKVTQPNADEAKALHWTQAYALP
jgi:hypothetical protein